MKKKIFYSLVIILVILVIANFKLIDYGISQAKGQIEIVWNARPNEEWLSDPDFPDSLKAKLELVGEIKKFAFDSLGVKYSENYSSMYDQKGSPLMFVVSACQPFSFEQKKFKFPVIGSFSYKGFFEEERAVKEETKLKEEGFDTNIRTAGGWSTLGWFKDPILSEMLNRGDGYLAETIIHELTHGTLFVKDSLKFNENLATFIGSHGARLFLKNKYGEGSDEYQNYINHWTDRRKYVDHILKGALVLDSVYANFSADMSIEEKKKVKYETINQILENIDTLGLSNLPAYRRYLDERDINNTFFMSYIRYNGEMEILESELKIKYHGNIKNLLADYTQRYPSL